MPKNLKTIKTTKKSFAFISCFAFSEGFNQFSIDSLFTSLL